MNTDINNFEIKDLEPNYELLLLTYYNTLNYKLNELNGDKSTLENVKKLVDLEMHKILGVANCRVLTIKDNI